MNRVAPVPQGSFQDLHDVYWQNSDYNSYCLSCIAHACFCSGGWERGKIVGLRAGTCIREGPGLRYRAHTRVPENDWAVMVIDGRVANGHTWWIQADEQQEIRAGGTGWVTEDQTDTDCNNVVAPGGTTNPGTGSGNSTSWPKSEHFYFTKVWWYQQSALVKWVVAVLALLLAPTLWRVIGGMIIEFIGAAFSGSSNVDCINI